jgi:putative ABC transport system ATP-binding protein
MSQNIVELKAITKQYSQGKIKVDALRGVDLIIEKGEFAALCGPSGSGKTTLLNIIGCLDDSTSGKVYVTDKNTKKLSKTAKAELRLFKIGFVFQSYNLVPVLTAFENVELILSLQGIKSKERKKRVSSILKEVGLEDMMHRRPSELSGGQQQRVAVARAVVAKPDLILADEPTANLDSVTGKALLEMMQELNRQHNITFLFSTHDKMVMDHSKRLIHIVDGKVHKDERKQEAK